MAKRRTLGPLGAALVGCGLIQQPAAPDRIFCFNVKPSDPEQCFATDAERLQEIAKLKAAAVARAKDEQREFLEEKAHREAAQEEQQRRAREEWERKGVELETKRATEQEWLNGIRRRALDPAVAVPAISALMCDLKGGPNAEWIDYWREILRERFAGARALSCETVQGIRDCHRTLDVCTDGDARAAAEVWQYAQHELKGGGLRADRPLKCCDGEESPSCTCGGPRRGCCSYHGGVCGCVE